MYFVFLDEIQKVISSYSAFRTASTLGKEPSSLPYGKRGIPTEFIPMGAVVTAFGTGAEMNNGAVITNEEKMLKSALWGAFHSFAIRDLESVRI